LTSKLQSLIVSSFIQLVHAQIDPGNLTSEAKELSPFDHPTPHGMKLQKDEAYLLDLPGEISNGLCDIGFEEKDQDFSGALYSQFFSHSRFVVKFVTKRPHGLR
jgi:hypothetical protein